MSTDEPETDAWRRLFASLTGDATVDAALIRAFCATHGVTPAQVMSEMHTHRRSAQQQE